MAKVRVRCPDCGPIELYGGHIELIALPGRPVEVVQVHYAFECTCCGAYTRRPVDRRTATQLVLAGAVVRAPEHPAGRGCGHPEAPPDGPPFTHDDLLELRLVLDRDDWSSALP